MMSTNHHSRRPATTIALLTVLLIGSWGCSTENPVAELRTLGADVKQDKRDNVTAVQYPVSAGDAGLRFLKEFDKIEELNLAGSQITDDGLDSIKELTSLERLNLSRTKITDKGLEHLADLENLKSLDLSETRVTDAGVESLKDLKALTRLSLDRSPKPVLPPERSPIRLGIDLAGGTNLVFQVLDEDPEKPLTSEVMKQMVGAVGRRINPSGTEEVTVRQVGRDRIEVIIPGADREYVEQIKKRITQLGSLEFAILANRVDHGPIGKRENKNIISRALRVKKDLRDENKQIIASWRRVARTPDGDEKPVGGRSPGSQTVFRTYKDPDGTTGTEFLVVFEPEDRRVTGKYLRKAYATTDQNSGGPAVGFLFNLAGGNRFSKLTGKYLPSNDFQRHLSILLDGQINSAPTINERISNSGQISGRFTREEVDELISVLNAGALVVPIKEEPISEFSITPLLGADVQEKGKWAIIIAAGLVFAFMPLYYWFSGAVADFCLLANLLLVLGTMAFIDATFTLPGIAGLVLTIGMAVDANVLIFERIREEKARGSSDRMAIQNGFARALTTIVDANVTTLLTAVVLYMIGTDQIRGFAVTLFIGIMMSMFSALFIGRLVFDIFERKRWLTGSLLKMGSMIGKTSLDFISKQTIAAVVSGVLILVGMAALFTRGERILDIDFTGGSMVTFQLTEPHGIKDVRAELEKTFEGAMTLEQLVLSGEVEGAKGKRFRLRTTIRDADRPEGSTQASVSEMVSAAFEGTGFTLRRISMQPGPIENIAKLPGDDEKAGDEGEKNAQATSLIDQQFAGGHKVKLTFYDEVSEDQAENKSAVVSGTTVLDYLAEALKKENPDLEDAQSLLEATVLGSRVEGNKRVTDIALKAQPGLSKSDLDKALSTMQVKLDTQPIFEEVNSFASSVAGEMRWSAIRAMFFSLIAIVGYIWFRFQRITFGFAAVAALVHDVLIVLGMVALASAAAGAGINIFGIEEFKINLPMIAAFMTIVGYSLNDTIVVFDRIREVRGKNPALTPKMVNLSLNQTLARTILTSLTTFIVVTVLYFLGGEGIHGFAFCLVMGVIVGTYSSIYVASPVLLWLMNREAPQIELGGAGAAKTAAT